MKYIRLPISKSAKIFTKKWLSQLAGGFDNSENFHNIKLQGNSVAIKVTSAKLWKIRLTSNTEKSKGFQNT